MAYKFFLVNGHEKTFETLEEIREYAKTFGWNLGYLSKSHPIGEVYWPEEHRQIGAFFEIVKE